MSKLVNSSRAKRNTILGGIALSVLLAWPMGCVGADPSNEAEEETTQDLSSSFLHAPSG